MKTILVRYSTHDTMAGENERLIHAVFDELRETAPGGFRYAAFKLADGRSFVHLAMLERPELGNPLSELNSFERFQEDLEARCAEQPLVVELSAVDSYAFGALAPSGR